MEKPNLIETYTYLIAVHYLTDNSSGDGRKLSLYYIKGTGFFITIESLNYIESVDELSAKEHYKFCQKKYQKFPKGSCKEKQ